MAASDGFGVVEMLGWADDALQLVENGRGWTIAAIERLELAWLADERRVGISVRDETGYEVGLLHYDPTGRLQPKMLADAGTPRGLFPPPELIGDAEPVGRVLWLVEGEPDAIRLWALGIAAVGVPGAGNWRDEWAARFAGRQWEIVVCFDCDAPGREHGERAAAALVAAGVTARLVDLDPDRDDGYDLSDLTMRARGAELNAQAARYLRDLAARYEPYRPETIGPHGPRPWRSMPWSQFRDTAPPAHRWLIEGMLPEGTLCFIAGPPKRGKTWIGIGLALALALGRPFAGEHPVPAKRDVLYVALEGSQTGLRTRIGALARGHDADPDLDDLEHLHMLYRPRPFDLAELATSDWLLEEALETDSALILIDVLRAAARFDENAAADFGRLRDHLEPLLASSRTVALLHHFGKLTETQKERSPGERMAGTGAMYGALDVGFLITRSEDGAKRLRLEVEARDFAAPEAIGLAITGAGSGKHGGFTYADAATMLVDVTAAEGRDWGGLAEELLADEVWRSGDELAEALETRRSTLESAFAGDGRIVRWDRDGREIGKAWNARPWGTPVMYEKARTNPGPSGPSQLAFERQGLLGPPSGGDRATEQAPNARPGPSEPHPEEP